MQKKPGKKSKGVAGSGGRAASAGRAGKAGKAKAKVGGVRQAAKAVSGGKAESAAKRGKGRAAKAGPASGKGKSAAAAPPKASPNARGSAASRPKAVGKRTEIDPVRDILSLPEELIQAVAPRASSAARVESMPDEDEGALRNVMASLTSIFGGKDFMSDAELDALLDSKMASGEIPPSAALNPLDEAQSLIYEAWNSEGPQRVRLARRALETSSDCADAYVILAEEDARDRKQALDLFRKGVEAGERALDPSLFRKSAGKFWGIMETRPYMRARLGLAECLWEAGKKDDALGHLRDLLRLNPSDNQGVRYILAQVLLETGEEGELGDLLERFRDDASPQIRFSHALWMFRHEGPGRKADALLAQAVESNPFVIDYLLKRKKPPKAAPRTAGAGSEEEAAAYAMGASESWQKTLGAPEWLAEKTR